jgi:hypothetical protein
VVYSKPIPLYKKLYWFVLLYAGGFLAMLAVAMIFRVLLLDAVN